MVVSLGCLRAVFGVVGDGERRTEGAIIGREESSEVGMLTAGGFWWYERGFGVAEQALWMVGAWLMTLSQLETPGSETKSGRE